MIEYRTIKSAGEHEIEIKKSRFICRIQRAYTKEEADAFVEEVRKEHYKATHNCVAYQIGERNEIQRALDDGEPSGTAGVPMLEVLKNMDLKNVACVVTRYFGGTKLGAGGLVRAYSGAVSEAVHQIGVVERRLQTQVDVTIDYSLNGSMAYWVENSPYSLLDTTYLEKVTYHLGVPSQEVDKVQEELTNLTAAQASFQIGEEVYVDIPVPVDTDQ